jgi:hypothetical protein
MIAHGWAWFCVPHDLFFLAAADPFETPLTQGHGTCHIENAPDELRWLFQQKYPEVCESRPWFLNGEQVRTNCADLRRHYYAKESDSGSSSMG